MQHKSSRSHCVQARRSKVRFTRRAAASHNRLLDTQQTRALAIRRPTLTSGPTIIILMIVSLVAWQPTRRQKNLDELCAMNECRAGQLVAHNSKSLPLLII